MLKIFFLQKKTLRNYVYSLKFIYVLLHFVALCIGEISSNCQYSNCNDSWGACEHKKIVVTIIIFHLFLYATTPYKIASAKLKDCTELRFTKKRNDLYIFLFSKPKSSSIFIPYSNSSQLSKVFLYDKNRKKLAYKVTSKGLTIKLPNNVDFGFAQMIKVTSSIKL